MINIFITNLRDMHIGDTHLLISIPDNTTYLLFLYNLYLLFQSGKYPGRIPSFIPILFTYGINYLFLITLKTTLKLS